MVRSSLIAFAVAVVAGLTSSAAFQSSERDAARTWFLEVQQQAYETVMPLNVPDLVVAYRASHEMHAAVHERYFAIRYLRLRAGFMTNALSATVVWPVGSSIQDQLISLRTKDRSAPAADMISRVSVRKETVDVDHCKAILSQVDRLSEVRVSMPRPDIITLDAPVHQVALNVGNLKMAATIEDDNAPLVRWALRTHELLLGCIPRR